MASLSISYWLIVVSIVVLVFWAHRLGSVGGNLEVAVRNFKRAVSLPIWFQVVVASIFLLCLFAIAKRLTAQ